MAQLSQTDASSIANAARCFNNCTGGSAESSLKTYLLTQTAGIATPPCITPTAPITSATAKVIGPNSLFITWNQISNSGSLITGYTVKWGTASGVYTNSATVPVIPRAYTITGLNTGTQYFWVIVANSSAAVGCSSANSTEGTATTSGASPSNQLLQSLISYWKFDDNQGSGANTADSIGGNPLLLSSANTSVAGIINLGLDVHVGSSHASHADNSDFSPAANTSLSLSFWISSSDWTTAGAGFTDLMIKGDNAVLNSYGARWFEPGNILQLYVEDTSTGTVNVQITSAAPSANTYHHVVFVFDSSNKQLRGYFDGVLIASTPTVTGSVQTGAQIFSFGPGAGHASIANLHIDEAALWHKALTQTDVTNIFNGGACLPLSSYQA